ncbi:hypothetical protein XINFAN_01930 [Pseudogemmobacter humi]|uniref:O-Antigen ligase n=1 Tax=Pseudogemmobacter humi TaxID=2483812 RepID=A0A3P5XBW1_9RHOB|nr:hypothetical protein XINFAN_01930 [Pseudogemmobacter humi]
MATECFPLRAGVTGRRDPCYPKACRRPDETALDITPTPIAWIALLAWPAVVWVLYDRMGPGRALIWSVLGAYMFLPELLRLDLPMLPDFDKHTLPALAAAVISWRRLGRTLPVLTGSRLTTFLIGLFVISPFVTVLGNTDPIVLRPGLEVPGLRAYDSLATVAMQGLYVLPLFLARRDLASPEALRDLLIALLTGGLLYTLPLLIEAELSPQLHTWIYGYFQHDFAQALRFGGFRPFVFMPHGLWVAFFMLCCLMASVALLRMGPAPRRPALLLVFLLFCALLVICKSFGPLAYALLALPLLFVATPRQQVLIAAGLAAMVMLYPLLRGAHLVPVQSIVDFAARLSEERALSFHFRLTNEDALLARAAERPLFGWGGYGRGFLFNIETGAHLTIADGAWIIQIGAYGWLGYLAEFGLLCLPLWLMAREALVRGARIAPQAAALALMLAFNLVDLLPNATLTPLTWLIAGAVLGHAEALSAARRAVPQAGAAAGRRTVI